MIVDTIKNKFKRIDNHTFRYKKNDEIILKKSIPESALWSEKSLSKTWMNKEEDEIWKYL